MSFADKVVLVTGGSGGIGAAIAESFTKEGAKVAIVGRNEAKLKTTADKCKAVGQTPLIIKGDISIDKDVKNIIQTTINTFKRLDVLVNNAGVFKFSNIFEENIMQTYDEIFKTNLRGTVYLTHLAIPYLIESKGNIVNISSSAGTTVAKSPKFLCYGMSKAGLNLFGSGVAKELAPYGIRVNTVSPGPVKTGFMGIYGLDEIWDRIKETTALGRVSEPEEVADIALFLASERAKGIHGSNYNCDNGLHV